MGVREGQTWTAMAQGSQGRWVEDVRQGCHHAKSAPSVKPHVMASTCTSPLLVRALILPACKVALQSPLHVFCSNVEWSGRTHLAKQCLQTGMRGEGEGEGEG